jgi:hypothetical protein
MVDRIKRSKAAVVLQRFIDGEISQFDFEEQFPSSRSDCAMEAISNMVWFFYDDLREHRLEGEHALTPDTRAMFERCILFLRSELEYAGPTRFITPEIPTLPEEPSIAQRFSCWISGRETPQPKPLTFTPSAWPFGSEEELHSLRREPTD